MKRSHPEMIEGPEGFKRFQDSVKRHWRYPRARSL